MGARKVSIVIPTHNGMPRFAAVLDAIERQRCRIPFDLIVIDTESRDGTWEELVRRDVRRLRITKDEFDHGATRARAARLTDGDLIVFTVQDATPADDRWLDSLVDALDSEPTAAGAFSRQVPYLECSPFLKMRLERWAAGRNERVVNRLPAGRSLADYAPLERLALCAMDDVASCVRRSVWEAIPTPRRRFGEDVAWGKAVIEAGYALVFEPRSIVIHSHDDGAWKEFTRIYQDHANLHELFGILTVPTLRDAWRNSWAQFGVYRKLIEDLAPQEGAREDMTWFAWRYAFAETFAQWLGARSVRKAPPRGIFAAIESLVAPVKSDAALREDDHATGT
jgi:rhamnosyltransferase